jgi:hypothetical protein
MTAEKVEKFSGYKGRGEHQAQHHVLFRGAARGRGVCETEHTELPPETQEREDPAYYPGLCCCSDHKENLLAV